MTITALHKLLGKQIENGHGRKPVCVDKSSFKHPLEDDGAVILDVASAKLTWVPQVDEDGGMKENADGTEAHRTCFVLNGGYGD